MPMCGLLAFILLDVLGASWFCILVSDIILGKFSFIIVSKISSVLSLFSFRFLQVYVAPFAVVPPSLYHLFLFFPVFFLLAFHILLPQLPMPRQKKQQEDLFNIYSQVFFLISSEINMNTPWSLHSAGAEPPLEALGNLIPPCGCNLSTQASLQAL